MLINEHTAISTSSILLVPYEASLVTTYHEWMKDEEIQESTASEPLSLAEEYAMQQSWRTDHDKLTFIACLPLSSNEKEVVGGKHDRPEKMVGDVNLFLSAAEEDEEGCVGELELMIAPPSLRRQGYGRATIIAFLHYIQTHLDSILAEYASKSSPSIPTDKIRLLQLKVKIGSKNEKSIKLFESIGFLRVGEGPNWFGEYELVLEGVLGEERMEELEKRWGVEMWREVGYVKGVEVLWP